MVSFDLAAGFHTLRSIRFPIDSVGSEKIDRPGRRGVSVMSSIIGLETSIWPTRSGFRTRREEPSLLYDTTYLWWQWQVATSSQRM